MPTWKRAPWKPLTAAPRLPRTSAARPGGAYEKEFKKWRAGQITSFVRQVRDTRNGYEIRGRIAVDTRRGGWRQGDGNYGNGWGGDYRGWNQSMRGYDAGSFKCRIERGRVVNIDVDGVRGL